VSQKEFISKDLESEYIKVWNILCIDFGIHDENNLRWKKMWWKKVFYVDEDKVRITIGTVM
jgi:hypothetical protein